MKNKIFKLFDDKMMYLYVLISVLPAFGSFISSVLYSKVIEITDFSNQGTVGKIIIYVIAFLFLPSLISLIRIEITAPFIHKTIAQKNVTLLDDFIHRSMENFYKNSSSTYVSICINDLKDYFGEVFSSIGTLAESVGMLLIAVISLLFVDGSIALFLLLFAVFSCALMLGAQKKNKLIQKDISKSNESYITQVNNLICGYETIKMAEADSEYVACVSSEIDHIEKEKARHRFVTALQDSYLYQANFLFTFLVLTKLAYDIFLSKASVAEAAFCIMIVNMAVQAVGTLVSSVGGLISAKGIVEKSQKVFEKTEPDIVPDKTIEITGNIEFIDVGIAYESKKILENVSFVIRPGDKVLIEGKSGSGKTTLINVLNKRLKNYTGQVLVEGVELREIDNIAYNNQVATISQDTFLLEDTLYHNLTLYKEGISDNRIYEVLSLVGLDSMVSGLEDGLMTKVENNGNNFSGGERQRIGIARALLQGAKVLLADEITASLPEDTAREIERTLLSLDITLLFISHRDYGLNRLFDQNLVVSSQHVWDVKQSRISLEERSGE